MSRGRLWKGDWAGVGRLSFAPGLDLVFSGFGFTVRALRSESVVSRFLRFRFFVF